jgi:hypothetical protein
MDASSCAADLPSESKRIKLSGVSLSIGQARDKYQELALAGESTLVLTDAAREMASSVLDTDMIYRGYVLLTPLDRAEFSFVVVGAGVASDIASSFEEYGRCVLFKEIHREYATCIVFDFITGRISDGPECLTVRDISRLRHTGYLVNIWTVKKTVHFTQEYPYDSRCSLFVSDTRDTDGKLRAPVSREDLVRAAIDIMTEKGIGALAYKVFVVRQLHTFVASRPLETISEIKDNFRRQVESYQKWALTQQ